jgi:hypothetical protein
MDLKRITTSIQSSSPAVDTFNKEANRWLHEAKKLKNKNLQDLLQKVEKTLELPNDLKKAEDCLMYSFLIQNRAL